MSVPLKFIYPAVRFYVVTVLRQSVDNLVSAIFELLFCFSFVIEVSVLDIRLPTF